MQVITGENVANKVDYSFGDHRGFWDSTVQTTYKEANIHNQEFLDKAKEFERKVMTLYIDNIRLYPRVLMVDTEADSKLVTILMSRNDLLSLCSLLPNNEFIIYTGQEDTPINDKIVVPWNVQRVYAVNALYNDSKVIPFPFGLQRKMIPNDNRLAIMQEKVDADYPTQPTKLFYVNMAIGRNKEREPLAEFKDNEWITTRFDKESRYFPYEMYRDFLRELGEHKFVACPPGHGMDTHRIWETLYMRRVPVMKRHPYFKKLLKGFPVLYIDNWYDVTHALLEENDHLFQQAQTMDLGRLDLEKIMATNKEIYAHL